MIWTRLALDPIAPDGQGGLSAPIEVLWEVAADETFSRVVASGRTTATADLGHSVYVEVAGLSPARPSWYRFTAQGQRSPTGLARSTPAPNAFPETLRLGVASCSNWEVGYFSVYGHMADEAPDLTLFLGDYIYEYSRTETPSAPRLFDEALGTRFKPEDAPTLTRLLGRMLGDLETIQTPAKRGFTRPRPFVTEPAATCIAPEPWLARSGSYPSGHSALGWAWALVLAEMAPDRADAVLARGLAYGESRMICGVHYASDVEAGRLVGAALVSALTANPEFQADYVQAARELSALRAAHP